MLVTTSTTKPVVFDWDSASARENRRFLGMRIIFKTKLISTNKTKATPTVVSVCQKIIAVKTRGMVFSRKFHRKMATNSSIERETFEILLLNEPANLSEKYL